MRRGKDARAYYACGNHLHKRTVMVEGTEAPCPMLSVFEQDVKNAFATALNRLAADLPSLWSQMTGEQNGRNWRRSFSP